LINDFGSVFKKKFLEVTGIFVKGKKPDLILFLIPNFDFNPKKQSF
jgi:hypothetical protein